MTTVLSKTATVRALRAAARLCREIDRDIPSYARVEVGTRTIPAHGATFEEALAHHQATGEGGSDLADYCELKDPYDEQIRVPGYVAHLYFTVVDQWGDGDLVTTCTVWLGNGDGPVAVHIPGVADARGRGFKGEQPPQARTRARTAGWPWPADADWSTATKNPAAE